MYVYSKTTFGVLFQTGHLNSHLCQVYDSRSDIPTDCLEHSFFMQISLQILTPNIEVTQLTLGVMYGVLLFLQCSYVEINLLTPNEDYSGRTAPLTSKCCILYIYSTNIGTEYFKHGIYSPFFPLQSAVCFIILTYLVPVLFTFYIQSVLKLKK